MFHLLFLNQRFNYFAKQAERMSFVLESLQRGTQQTSIVNETIRNTMTAWSHQFYTTREKIVPAVFAYQKQTRTWKGFFYSFIPGTHAFQCRRELGHDLKACFRAIHQCHYWHLKLTILRHEDEKTRLKLIQSSISKKINIIEYRKAMIATVEQREEEKPSSLSFFISPSKGVH